LLFELLAIQITKLLGFSVTPLAAPLDDSILHKWDVCFKMLWEKQWITHYLLVSQRTLLIYCFPLHMLSLSFYSQLS